MKRPLVDRVNRFLFTVVGLVLVVAGIGALLLGFGVFGTARSELAVLDYQLSANITSWSWFWPVVAGVSLVLAGFAFWWLLGQLSVARVTRLTLAATGGGSTTLAASAITEAVREDALTTPGVERARVRMVRGKTRPDLRLTVWLVEPYDLAETLRALEGHVLPRAAQALGGAPLQTFLEMEVGRSTAQRVS